MMKGDQNCHDLTHLHLKRFVSTFNWEPDLQERIKMDFMVQWSKVRFQVILRKYFMPTQLVQTVAFYLENWLSYHNKFKVKILNLNVQ